MHICCRKQRSRSTLSGKSEARRKRRHTGKNSMDPQILTLEGRKQMKDESVAGTLTTFILRCNHINQHHLQDISGDRSPLPSLQEEVSMIPTFQIVLVIHVDLALSFVPPCLGLLPMSGVLAQMHVLLNDSQRLISGYCCLQLRLSDAIQQLLLIIMYPEVQGWTAPAKPMGMAPWSRHSQRLRQGSPGILLFTPVIRITLPGVGPGKIYH